MNTSAVVRRLATALSVLLVVGSSVSATSAPTEEGLDQLALMWPLSFNLIVDAEVLAVRADTLTNKYGYCQYVSKIELLPRRSLWGNAGDRPFLALTPTLPMELRNDVALLERYPGISGCRYSVPASGPEEPALPRPGEKGIFLLRLDSYAEGTLALGTVRNCYVRIDENNHVRIPSDSPDLQPYDLLLQKLQQETRRLEIDRTVSEADVVAVGFLGSRSEHKFDAAATKIPFHVEDWVKGNATTDRLELVLHSSHSMKEHALREFVTNRWLAGRISRLLSNRVIVFGRLAPPDQIIPLGFGCLPVDAEEMVVLRKGSVSPGRSTNIKVGLEEIRGYVR